MDIFEGFRSLLHCLHRLRVEVGILERVDLHLELHPRPVQSVHLDLELLLPPESSSGDCRPITVSRQN